MTDERNGEHVNQKFYDALASTIYFCRMTAKGAAVETDDQRIRASGLYDDFTPGAHNVGDIYNAVGQTWECFAEFDNAVYPDIVPGQPAWFTFNRPLHGTSVETARMFVQPQHGTTDMYHAGEYAVFTDGKTYRCKSDTNFSPAEYPDAWEDVTEMESSVTA